MDSGRERLITRRLWLETAGQDLVEFALLMGFVAVSAVAGLDTATEPLQRIYRRVRKLLARAAEA